MTATTARQQYAGSGGGAAGYIRINTRFGTFTLGSDTVISPAETSGSVVTQ